MFEKILFPTDFSEYARKTLDCVAGFPGVREVIIFHVIEAARSPRGGGEIGEAFFGNGEGLLKEERRYLESLSQDFRVTTAVTTSSDTAGAIIRTAEESGVSLIVLGARGKSLVGGVLLGSVSTAVLHRSKTSVLFMRHKIIEELGERTLEKFCPMILYRVLCPVDFSAYSDSAVDLLVRTKGMGDIILMHVVSRGESDDEIRESVEKARARIEEIRDNLSAKGFKARTLVSTGNPASEIARIADQEDVSVIWMSSHGKGWFRELLVGSTAQMVATTAMRPVIIIRKPE
ncbi:MAG: universal stress protein [Methanoregulaceae archaeon]|nr:universal stress protein [Methanoregulaceae archaeon]